MGNQNAVAGNPRRVRGQTRGLEGGLIEDVFDDRDRDRLVGRAVTFADGWVRAYVVPPVPFLRGSKIVPLVYCGAFKDLDRARAGIIRRAQHEGVIG